MSDDPQPSLEGISLTGTDDRFRKLVTDNAKSIQRSRSIRRGLRISILVSFVLMSACFYFHNLGTWIVGFGLLFMLIVLVSAGALTMMGGLAPDRVRVLMTDREKRLLDD